MTGCKYYQCSSLTEITIPNSVVWIGEEAFYRCSNLSNIIIQGEIDWISDSAFKGCNLPFIITSKNR
ncbi:MAG: leucine-rich repeat protein [Muribaculaceae bacterium]|nr:leucine-rich repeat protein [Muribaculaceae bacterium]